MGAHLTLEINGQVILCQGRGVYRLCSGSQESGRQIKCFRPSGGHKTRLLEGINNIQGIPLEQ